MRRLRVEIVVPPNPHLSTFVGWLPTLVAWKVGRIMPLGVKGGPNSSVTLLQEFARACARRRRQTPPAAATTSSPATVEDNGHELAKALLDGLKDCLNKGGSEEDILRVLALAFQSKSATFQNHNPEVPKSTNEGDAEWYPRGDWADWNTSWQTPSYQNDWWDGWAPCDWTECYDSTPTPADKPATRTVVMDACADHQAEFDGFASCPKANAWLDHDERWPGLDSRFMHAATSVRASDWMIQHPPKLITLHKLKKCLMNGDVPDGNVVEIWDGACHWSCSTEP